MRPDLKDHPGLAERGEGSEEGMNAGTGRGAQQVELTHDQKPQHVSQVGLNRLFGKPLRMDSLGSFHFVRRMKEGSPI